MDGISSDGNAGDAIRGYLTRWTGLRIYRADCTDGDQTDRSSDLHRVLTIN